MPRLWNMHIYKMCIMFPVLHVSTLCTYTFLYLTKLSRISVSEIYIYLLIYSHFPGSENFGYLPLIYESKERNLCFILKIQIISQILLLCRIRTPPKNLHSSCSKSVTSKTYTLAQSWYWQILALMSTPHLFYLTSQVLGTRRGQSRKKVLFFLHSPIFFEISILLLVLRLSRDIFSCDF